MAEPIKEEQATPAQPNWRDGLDPRIKAHVAYCQDYVAKHNHGAPGHLAHLTTDALAKLLDGGTVEIVTTVEINLSGVAELQQQIADLIAKHGGAL
jgi:hypothetical protein